ncbi:hypothetical protein Clacol_008683 [Clathrus columnatus]|uniref:gamma-glutamylcyclotransferase n=1 Tax=Clathrus columnatus TaxID=1419009 RepID=A0AAV5AMR6_9AGAM|nr:hypothetical protein Clacol_008683 [Clathrus columnatus]
MEELEIQLPNPNNRWYLAYNSNMPSGTFFKKGIVPLASHVVRVPNVELIFNVPFLPFCEPTLANLRFISEEEEKEKGRSSDVIGVAYLLTLEDYQKIVALESRGTLYQETIVECYPLSRRLASQVIRDDTSISPSPTGSSSSRSDYMDIQILASTLISPYQHSSSVGLLPSKRYVDLMKYGANGKMITVLFMHPFLFYLLEHRFPSKYRRALENIQYYEIKGFPQSIAAVVFLLIWIIPLSISLALRRVSEPLCFTQS